MPTMRQEEGGITSPDRQAQTYRKLKTPYTTNQQSKKWSLGTCLVCTLRAQMRKISAKGASPIQRFCPSSLQPDPSWVAVVESPAASDPCPGSVSPQAPNFSNLAILGSHSICSKGNDQVSDVIFLNNFGFWTEGTFHLMCTEWPKGSPRIL